MSAYSSKVFWIVGIILTVLTVVEYIIAVEFENNFSILAVFALGKAGAIVYYFMHMYRLWRAQEAH